MDGRAGRRIIIPRQNCLNHRFVAQFFCLHHDISSKAVLHFPVVIVIGCRGVNPASVLEHHIPAKSVITCGALIYSTVIVYFQGCQTFCMDKFVFPDSGPHRMVIDGQASTGCEFILQFLCHLCAVPVSKIFPLGISLQMCKKPLFRFLLHLFISENSMDVVHFQQSFFILVPVQYRRCFHGR